MTQNSIYEKILNIIQYVKPELTTEQISPESSIKLDLKLSSLSMITMITNIEKEFSISIEEDSWFEVENLQDIIDLVEENVKE